MRAHIISIERFKQSPKLDLVLYTIFCKGARAQRTLRTLTRVRNYSELHVVLQGRMCGGGVEAFIV